MGNVQLSLLFFLVCLIAPPSEPASKRSLAKDRAAAPAVRESIGADLKVTESYVRRSIIRTKTPYGFLIRKVDRDSPAARAGLKSGDILMKWDGRPVKSVEELLEWIRAAKSGETIVVQIARKKTKVGIWSRHPWEDLELRIKLK